MRPRARARARGRAAGCAYADAEDTPTDMHKGKHTLTLYWIYAHSPVRAEGLIKIKREHSGEEEMV